MSMNLDKRQRAMLREMGVRVWQPLAPPVPMPLAPEKIAFTEDGVSAGGHSGQHSQEYEAITAAAAPVAMRESTPPRTANLPVVSVPPPAAGTPAGLSASWQLGQAQALYAPTAQPGGARWLVLAETPASALQSPVFEGDAGRLLDNMLRAARLNQAGAVLFAPLVRHADARTTEEFSAALSALVARAQPDVVLIMGRLAALALLPSGEPFGKLRGRVHALHGAKTIVTYDAPYLLRTPADKARAWDDLCLAMSLTASA